MPQWAVAVIVVAVCVAGITGTRILRARLVARARENGATPDRSLPRMAVYIAIGALLFIAGAYLLTTH
jgi:hypothetical protein